MVAKRIAASSGVRLLVRHRDFSLVWTAGLVSMMGDWVLAIVLPILQDTTIVAAGPRVQNVSLSGAVPIGIVGDAGKWAKEP